MEKMTDGTMHRLLMTFLALATLLTASGCGNRFWEDTKDTAQDTYQYVFDTKPTARSYHETESVPIEEINYQAADTLYAHLGNYELSKDAPIFYTYFVNKQNASDHAIFGQVMTEQILDRMVQRGARITHGDPPPDAYFMPSGVDPKKYTDPVQGGLDKLPPRSGQLSGGYVIGDQYIYMSAKITRLDDKAVVSAHTWTIPINDNVRQLLPQLKLDDGLEPTVKTKF